MQFKLLATLLLSTLTLASPVAVAQDSASNYYDAGQERIITIPPIPSSIMTVLATAVPASWYEEIFNSDSRSSITSEIAAGTMPAWYNALPASVKAWASSAGGFADNFVAATPTASVSSGGIASASESIVTATPVATANSTSKSKAQQTSSETTASVSQTIASSSKSSSPTSATSTGGAPIATGDVAMSLAGAFSLLGLALAL